MAPPRSESSTTTSASGNASLSHASAIDGAWSTASTLGANDRVVRSPLT